MLYLLSLLYISKVCSFITPLNWLFSLVSCDLCVETTKYKILLNGQPKRNRKWDMNLWTESRYMFIYFHVQHHIWPLKNAWSIIIGLTFTDNSMKALAISKRSWTETQIFHRKFNALFCYHFASETVLLWIHGRNSHF